MAPYIILKIYKQCSVTNTEIYTPIHFIRSSEAKTNTDLISVQSHRLPLICHDALRNKRETTDTIQLNLNTEDYILF